MAGGLLQFVLDLVTRFGWVAIFLYMILETSFLLHFVPSEVVVPFAATELVHDPVTFVLFVGETTAGATIGSLVAYGVFGREGRAILERYGHLIHVSETSLDRSQAVFVRYGESTVFWGRMLPFLRALISIPAGLAAMDLRRFVAYSAGGALVFNAGLTYLVYSGAGTTSPLQVIVGFLGRRLGDELGYLQAHTRFVLVVVGLVVLVGAGIWLARDWIRTNPVAAKGIALHVVRLIGLAVGGLFLAGALSSPHQAFSAVTAVWNDPRFFTERGFSEQVALTLVGGMIAVITLAIYELGQIVRVAHVQSARARVESRFRRE